MKPRAMQQRIHEHGHTSGGGIRVTRRRALAGLGAVAMLPTLAAPALAEPRPLRIGMITSLSGPFTALGESMRAGMRLLLAQSGDRFAGRLVELIVEDDQARPDDGVRKARKLIGQDKVDLLCGVISSGVALALRDVATEAQMPTFLLGSANDLARKAASPFIVRPTKTNWMLGSTAAGWSHGKHPGARVITAASDYAAGREFVGDFAQTYRDLGGQIGRQFWTPLGTADFGPLLTAIAAERPDSVYVFFAGSDAVRFLRQWKEYRLAGRIRLTGTDGAGERRLRRGLPRHRQATTRGVQHHRLCLRPGAARRGRTIGRRPCRRLGAHSPGIVRRTGGDRLRRHALRSAQRTGDPRHPCERGTRRPGRVDQHRRAHIPAAPRSGTRCLTRSATAPSRR
jgi:ABC-type branched-subunit amino acid transport system substrate-binding protein